MHESQFILRLKQAVLAPPPAFRPSLVGVALASAMTILGISTLYDTIQIQEEKTEIIRVFKSTWAYADFFSCRSVQLKQLHDDYKRHSDKVAKSARKKKIKGLRAEISHDISTRRDTGNKTEFSKIK